MILFTLLLFSSCGKNPGAMNKADTKVVTQALACDSSSGSYCGQPPMPVCPPNIYCVQVMPAPKTYSNECTMKDAGATFIQAGTCPSTSL